MKKISLIVPIYNTEKYIEKCIISLINQTLEDIEIILINDGSTDKSESIIKKYKDSRIKYISKKNEGIGKTRNLGIKKASGKYIAFVDSDDFLEPNFCEKMYNKAEKDNCEIVVCNFFDVINGKPKERNIDYFEDSSVKKQNNLINKINLGPCNKIYLLKMIKQNNIYFEEKLKYEDVPFVLKSILKAKKIGKINDSLTNYVIHEKSQTTTRDYRISDILKICDIAYNMMKNDKSIHEEMVNLLVSIITDYTIQQRYIKDSKFRNKFIDEAFIFLNSVDYKWKKCSFLKKYNLKIRIIKTSKILTKLYCYLYQLIMH